MTIGHCPESEDEVALSERTARLLGTTVGRTVTLPQLTTEPEEAGTGDPFPSELRIVGVYRPPDPGSACWAGSDLFDTAPAGVGIPGPGPGTHRGSIRHAVAAGTTGGDPGVSRGHPPVRAVCSARRRRRPGGTRAGPLGGRAPRRRGSGEPDRHRAADPDRCPRRARRGAAGVLRARSAADAAGLVRAVPADVDVGRGPLARRRAGQAARPAGVEGRGARVAGAAGGRDGRRAARRPAGLRRRAGRGRGAAAGADRPAARLGSGRRAADRDGGLA